MSIKKLLVAAVALLLTANMASARSAIPLEDTETSAFVGLYWAFGPSGGTPMGRIGAIRATTNLQGDVEGFRAFYQFTFTGTPGRVGMTIFNGDLNSAGEVGFGYDFGGEFFGQFGIFGDHWDLGATYGFSSHGLGGYAGATSYGLDAIQSVR